MNETGGCVITVEYSALLYSITMNIYKWGLLGLFVLGIIGTAFSLLIFTRKRFSISSSSCYLLGSTISNTIILVFSIGRRLLIEGFAIDLKENRYLWWCRTRFFIAHLAYYLSTYLLVLASLDRFLGTYREWKYRRWCTKTVAHRVIFTLTLTMILTNIHVLLLFQIENGYCYAHGFYRYFLELSFFLFQNVFMIVSMVLLGLLTVYKAQKQLSGIIGFGGRGHRLKQFRQAICIQASIICILLFPRAVQKLYTTVKANYTTSHSHDECNIVEREINQLITAVVAFMEYMNYSLFFYLYVLAVPAYRSELQRLISKQFQIISTQSIAYLVDSTQQINKT